MHLLRTETKQGLTQATALQQTPMGWEVGSPKAGFHPESAPGAGDVAP